LSKYEQAGLTGLCTAILRRAIQDAKKETDDYGPAKIWLAKSEIAEIYFDYIGVERQFIIEQMKKRGINVI
jgi:hypothetical protein